MKNNRKCIVTHKKFPKELLIRIVKTKNNQIFISNTIAGRGVYISKNIDYNLVIKNRLLNRAFKMEVPKEIYDQVILILKGSVNNGE